METSAECPGLDCTAVAAIQNAVSRRRAQVKSSIKACLATAGLCQIANIHGRIPLFNGTQKSACASAFLVHYFYPDPFLKSKQQDSTKDYSPP
jgi:hypothetical protein